VTRVLLALVIGAGVATVALALRRRVRVDPPSQAPAWQAPSQLDRNDFTGADVPWLVVVFSSATCDACAAMLAKAKVLESPSVAVQEVEYTRHRVLHQRYRIEAVPTLVIADLDGVVRRSYHGPISATDLWAAVAAVRDPETRLAGPCEPPAPPGGGAVSGGQL
jgi:hypothetical protein